MVAILRCGREEVEVEAVQRPESVGAQRKSWGVIDCTPINVVNGEDAGVIEVDMQHDIAWSIIPIGSSGMYQLRPGLRIYVLKPRQRKTALSSVLMCCITNETTIGSD